MVRAASIAAVARCASGGALRGSGSGPGPGRTMCGDPGPGPGGRGVRIRARAREDEVRGTKLTPRVSTSVHRRSAGWCAGGCQNYDTDFVTDNEEFIVAPGAYRSAIVVGENA